MSIASEAKQAKAELQAAAHEVLDRIGREVVLPAMARNYSQSGLKKRSGELYRALTSTNAKGSAYKISANRLTFGVDYDAIPHARYVIEGRRAVVAKPGKVLRFYDDAGKPVFAKRVRAVPPHDIVYLTDADMDKAQKIASEMAVELIVRRV